ncbi:hypothetical protein J2Y41_003858 [Arthrobacter sp. 1088]|uniref:hypothetical protein n=1 Tax=Arthrobacter sp. 1088 TaxID=2817768 RepID=UPI00285EC2BC|nr:hypothetical protein [Arthrobacter sp. 1088]MDR6688272.1 hypothetical protein [Arthrobacter sp. 1088]
MAVGLEGDRDVDRGQSGSEDPDSGVRRNASEPLKGGVRVENVSLVRVESERISEHGAADSLRVPAPTR